MTDQPDEQPIQFGPTRAMLTVYETNPPTVFFLDVNNVGIATHGLSEDQFETIRQGLATILGPLPEAPGQEPDDVDEDDEGRGKGKGKKKDKGKKNRPDWAGDPDHPDHPRNRDKDETPDSPDDALDPDDVIDPINPGDYTEPAEGDVNINDDRVVVNAAVEIDPDAFAAWHTATYPGQDVVDPALSPTRVAEYIEYLANTE